jgi:DNA processing protein
VTDAAPRWPEGFASGRGNRDALLVLLGLDSWTPRKLIELAERHPSAAGCLEAIRRGAGSSERDRDRAGRLSPRAVAAAASEAGARLVALGDDEYPPVLLDLFDPPAGLFVRGRDLREDGARVAIVGARNATPSGREVAHGLGRALAQAGATVVSGAARGIDSAAHGGALAGRGPTLAVLGSGIDVAYPRAHADLVERIAAVGSVVSEYPPGTQPRSFRFPARNRLVAGLSSGVVVVEGAERSGSIITAEHALDLGRTVFAVPGPVASELSWVPLTLIREGATLIRNETDLLEDLSLASPETTGEAAPPPDGLRRDEVAAWKALRSTMTLEAVAVGAGLSIPAALAALSTLEVRGLARSTGGRFEPRRRSRGGPSG